jgi:hypothetical protein
MKHAFFIKRTVSLGDAALYELSVPCDGHKFVVVSKVNHAWATETFMFPADSTGEITEWLEMDYSRSGIHSHADILAIAGYAVVPLIENVQPVIDV